MKLNHHLFFLIVFILLQFSGISQTPYTQEYSTEHGLPSMETYQVRQDSKGYIWVATDRGVCRFNGTEFVVYNQKDGLEDITVFCLKEDNRGRMWAASFLGKLFYFENERFHSFGTNKVFDHSIGVELIDDIVIYEDTVWLSVADKIVKIDATGNYESFPSSSSFSLMKFAEVDYTEVIEGSYLFSRVSRPRDINYIFRLNENNDTTVCKLLSNHLCKGSSSKVSMVKLSNGDFLAALCSSVFVIEKNGSCRRLPLNIFAMNSSILEDENGIVWLGSSDNGVWQLDPSKDYAIVGHYLENYSITFIEKDKEGGMWFSTLERGLLYMPSPNILNIKLGEANEKLRYVDMQICAGKLYVTTRNALFEISRLNEQWEVANVSTKKITSGITDMSCFQRNVLLSVGIRVYKLANKKVVQMHRERSFGYMLPDDTVLYIMRDTLIKIDSSFQKKKLNHIGLGRNRVRRAHIDKSGRIWMGKLDGLYVYKNDTAISLAQYGPAFKCRVTNIIGKDEIIVSTLGHGVLFVDPETMNVSYLNVKNGLPDNNCSTVYQQESGGLWVATSKGLCYFLKDKSGEYLLKKKFTAFDGIVSGEILAITEFEDRIWILAQDGISMISLNDYQINSLPPSVKISSTYLMNQDTVVNLNNNVDLSYNRNDVGFKFEGISYKNAFEKTYAYRLLGLDSVYRLTSDNYVQYLALQPGNYTFEVKALNSDGVMSEVPASFSFTISPPFWNQLWFLLLVVFFLLISGVFAVRVRDRARSLKIKQELSLLENEQKAVTAQINPHFIYNAMNSIQYYVLENDSSKAVDYLAKSSELMRKVLMNTKSSFISLSSEVSILKLYLQLEKERFEEKFHYDFKIDEKLRMENILIPSMVVQPHIENAIWHGLLNKTNGDRKLEINLKGQGDQLFWRIVDNGVGRDFAKKQNPQKQGGYTSSGIDLTEKRLRLLSKQINKLYSIEIIDLKDQHGNGRGTEVNVVMYKKMIQT